jgi:hypothetical protein
MEISDLIKIILFVLCYTLRRDADVKTLATGWMTAVRYLEGQTVYLFGRIEGPTSWPNQSSSQWVPGTLLQGIKWAMREV